MLGSSFNTNGWTIIASIKIYSDIYASRHYTDKSNLLEIIFTSGFATFERLNDVVALCVFHPIPQSHPDERARFVINRKQPLTCPSLMESILNAKQIISLKQPQNVMGPVIDRTLKTP